jgi:hypothetical protein
MDWRSSVIKPRKIQSRIKHDILSRYIQVWGRIILYGLRSSARIGATTGRPFRTRFVYVDGFAGDGQYDGEDTDKFTGEPRSMIFGSPVIGIEALDSIRELTVAELPPDAVDV